MKTLNFMASQAYSLIRHYDPELADTFYRFYQEHPSAGIQHDHVKGEIRAMNHFFRDMLAQIDAPSMEARVCLDDTIDSPRGWLTMFEWEILPLLQRHRFPTVTRPFTEDFYAPQGNPQPV
jgi:hypothetical protein